MTTPDALLADLRRATAEDRVLGRELERVAFASDASMYHLVPRAVVLPTNEAEVAAILGVARRHRVPVTFRAAGTSLSGQGVTDGILVEVARHWKGATVLSGGARVRARPGMIGAHLNAILAPHGTRLGPDPSSLAACTLGGILANNSSGPCSGVEQNSYRTLESLRGILADGTAFTTSDAEAGGDADAALRAKAPALHAGLDQLRRDLRANAALTALVERKHRTKNTTGYGLNSLLDFERPVDILAHALIGSEGTLGFISEAVLRTVPLLPHTAGALLLFPTIHAACEAIAPFRDAGARLIELLDEASLRAVAGHPGMPAELRQVPPGAAALLIQLQAASAEELEAREEAARGAAAGLTVMGDARFTRDRHRQEEWLHARKGLYPAVGGRRPAGTSLLLEDVAFPVERLAAGTLDLQRLFRTHAFDDAVIFGHAKDGNLHFLVTQSVADAASVDRYGRFLDDVVDLVARRHGGALKAEHGTGRNMAPFVGTEWGAEAVALMRRLKALCDPDGVLSPGVVLTDRPRAHLEHLKTAPTSDAETDRCVECGYCEPVCASRALTLTPRQRIVVRRERARRRERGDATGVAALEQGWHHAGLDTCAVDGLCALACPVGIDTGTLVARLRAEDRTPLTRAAATVGAAQYGALVTLGRMAVGLGHAVGLGLPAPGHAAPDPRSTPEDVAVYFPSCTGRLVEGGGDPLLRLAERAGVRMRVPPGLAGSCCGLPFDSKGFPDAGRAARERTGALLRRASDAGRLPVVVSGSSCTAALAGAPGGEVIDAVSFAWRHLVPRLSITGRVPDLALHVPCGARHLGMEGELRLLAGALAERVTVPLAAGCCGFAGDRGLTHPELTASAAAPMAGEIAAAGHTLGATSNLTCGIGMARACGIPFRDILEVLEEATR